MSTLGIHTRIWQRWKSLKLPWRRRWLAGTDLAGNSYYYFKPTSAPPRRILQGNSQIPYSDIQITPSWHQWLRHTRHEPPSLREQQLDVMRQQQLKQLAAAADARWAAKPSVMDRPKRSNQDLAVGDGEGTVGSIGERGEVGRQLQVGETGDQITAEGKESADTAAEGHEMRRQKREKTMTENPWKKQQRGAAGEGYQPETWTPGPVRR